MINTIINIMFMGKWIDRVYIYRVSFILFDKFRIYSQIRSNSDNESFARLIVSRKIHGKISKTQIRLHFVAVEMGFERGSLGCNRIGASFAEILFTIIKIAKNKNIQRSKIILWDKWIRLNVAEIVSTNPVFLCPVWLEKSRVENTHNPRDESRVTKSPALRNLTLHCSKMSFHLKRINFQ